jgi:hypothetical protein
VLASLFVTSARRVRIFFSTTEPRRKAEKKWQHPLRSVRSFNSVRFSPGSPPWLRGDLVLVEGFGEMNSARLKKVTP